MNTTNKNNLKYQQTISGKKRRIKSRSRKIYFCHKIFFSAFEMIKINIVKISGPWKIMFSVSFILLFCYNSKKFKAHLLMHKCNKFENDLFEKVKSRTQFETPNSFKRGVKISSISFMQLIEQAMAFSIYFYCFRTRVQNVQIWEVIFYSGRGSNYYLSAMWRYTYWLGRYANLS